MRHLFIVLLLLAPAASWAQDCYFFWVHQCIDVIDASKRHLQQHVLISPQIYHLTAEQGLCSSAVAEQQSLINEQVLAAFSTHSAKIKACDNPLTTLPARSFSSMQKAQWHYNRARQGRANKQIIVVENLPNL